MGEAKRGPELERLGAMVGSWIGDELMHPSAWSPESRKAEAKVETRYACDGQVVVVDYRQERDGEVTYRGHGVFGYHAPTGRYLQHWSDSMSGIATEATPGTWDGETLTFLGKGPMGQVRYAYRFPGPDAYEFAMAMSADGETWQPLVDAKYRRA